METTRILLIEDDEEDYFITRDLVKDIRGARRYQLDWISDYNEAKKIIRERRHDVYFLDYHLGKDSGLDLLREVYEPDFQAPFIFLTGQSHYDIDEQAMLAGATDFLVKGSVTAGELERTIRYGIRQVKNLQEIRQLNSSLEKRVQERTTELAQTIEELKVANTKLQATLQEKDAIEKKVREALEKEKTLNELKSRFVTMASHEFRTPLSTILSSVQLLTHYMVGVDLQKTSKHVQRIRSNVAALTDLLDDFLSLEKLEEGKEGVKPEHFDLTKLVSETVEEIQAIAKNGQQIDYIIHEEHGPHDVVMDKRHIKGILANLLSNATKYSPDNSVIQIETFSYPDKQVIQVSDHGIGIPVEEQAHLFDRFFRAKNAVNVKGTGLGLSIVKKYLDLMGGTIRFKSDPQSGSTFYVTVPNKVGEEIDLKAIANSK